MFKFLKVSFYGFVGISLTLGLLFESRSEVNTELKGAVKIQAKLIDEDIRQIAAKKVVKIPTKLVSTKVDIDCASKSEANMTLNRFVTNRLKSPASADFP